MTVSVTLAWSCPSGCNAARKLIGGLVREHLHGVFTTVLATQSKQYFLHHADKKLSDVLDALDKVGQGFTAQRAFGEVYWVESSTKSGRSYTKGKIHVDRVNPEHRSDPSEKRQHETAKEESSVLDRETETRTMDRPAGDPE